MLNALVASINNDTSHLSEKSGVEFPKHLTDEVCEFIITGDRYFDFRGRSGLISNLKKHLPNDHFLIIEVKKKKYSESLNQLSGLRNFAAHDSKPSKRAALKAIDARRLSSAGAWLKKQERFTNLAEKFLELSEDIHEAAPY